jgi:hypothetical protein
MRKVLILAALAFWFVGCSNDGAGTGTGNTDTGATDTATTPNTTYYGGAGSGGAGAGFGAGERPGTDTNLPLSADTSRTGGNR